MNLNQLTNINDPDFVLNNLNNFQATEVIYRYVNHADFTEQFIISNLNYFGKTICTKSTYSNIKCTRKLLEPSRDFLHLDRMFY